MSPPTKTPVAVAPWRPGIPDAEECRRRLGRLTPRQHQVVEMMARGWAAKQIARHLDLEPKTVRVYVDTAAKVLDVHPPMPAVIALFYRAQEVSCADPDLMSADDLWVQLRTLRAS